MLPIFLSRSVRRDVTAFVGRELLPHKVSYDQEHIDAAVRWITGSYAAPSGPVRAGYDLRTGWVSDEAAVSTSVIPTLLHYAELCGHPEATSQALALAPPLLDVQRPDGSFRPGAGGSSTVAVTADALLALLALAARGDPVAEKGAIDAADWLIAAQGDDGGWPDGRMALAPQGHALWALARAGSVLESSAYRDTAAHHARWIGSNRRSDGWLGDDDRTSVEMRDLARTIEGLIEASVLLDDPNSFEAGFGLLSAIERAYRRAGSGVHLRWRNHLAGAISPSWRGSRRAACIEGSTTLALCAYRAARFGADEPSRIRRFGDEILDAARSAQVVGGVRPELYGAVSATAPIWRRPSALVLSVAAARSLTLALLERRDGGLPVERLG